MMWRFEGFSGMDGPSYVGVEVSQHRENFLSMHVLKASRWEKKNCAIVESIHLSSMCAAYNHHCAIYNKNKSQNTQLIPNVVWKVVYASYKSNYLELKFKEETLKERLQETLRELKTMTLNEKGLDIMVLLMKKCQYA